jgi:hypothetical protein
MRADALVVATDAFFFTRATQLVVLAARHAIPTVYFRREFVTAGGLMSYGSNQSDSYRLLGVYTARQASDPADAFDRKQFEAAHVHTGDDRYLFAGLDRNEQDRREVAKSPAIYNRSSRRDPPLETTASRARCRQQRLL